MAYPFVLVHGFRNMGEAFKQARGILNDLGYEAYAPHVPPYSSLWDRACELYAILLGGTVDYGKAHAEKYGHARFGRTYPGIYPAWGQLGPDGKRKKVYLIAHSFAGPTCRLLMHLLAEGSKEERKATKPEDLSPLFLGGNTDWVACLYTLASPLNGTTLVDDLQFILRTVEIPKMVKANQESGTGGKLTERLMLDQFGFASLDQKLRKRPLEILRFLYGDDMCYSDMSLRGMAKACKDFKTYPNVYYFSQPAQDSVPKLFGLIQVPEKRMLTKYKISTWFMNFVHGGKGREWIVGDGRVNVISQKFPFGHPNKTYESLSEVKPGTWYVLPIIQMNHTSFIGFGETYEDMYVFYKALAERVSALPEIK